MSSPLPLDPYEALGIDQDADLETIKKAHRKLALKLHPDRNKDPDLLEENTNRFQRVQQAYELLVDPARRQIYHDKSNKLDELRRERGLNREASRIYTERAPRSTYEERYPSTESWYKSDQNVKGQSKWWDRLSTNAKKESPKEWSNKRGTYRKEAPKTQVSYETDRHTSSRLSMAMKGKAQEPRERTRKKEDRRKRDKGRRKDTESDPRRKYAAFVSDGESSSDSDTVAVSSTRAKVPLPRTVTQSVRPRRQSHDSVSGDARAVEWERLHSQAQDYIAKSRRGRPIFSRQNSSSEQIYRSQPQRSSSVRSNASSANRSLGDGRKSSFDNQYQRPDFARRRAGSASSYEIRHESPSLPPAPARRDSSPGFTADRNRPVMPSKLRPASNLTQSTLVTTRNCYLCNRDIQIARKRDWQLHLLDDLEPYQCIEEACLSTTTFKSLKSLQAHYQQKHSKAPIMCPSSYKCLFCEEELPITRSKRFKHIGAHLQDHAFSIIPHLQSGRQFYSDSSSDDELSVLQRPRKRDSVVESVMESHERGQGSRLREIDRERPRYRLSPTDPPLRPDELTDPVYSSRPNGPQSRRGLMPLHIPPHVKQMSRSRQLSEPLNADDFGDFSSKNLSALEKANRDIIEKLRKEAQQAQARSSKSIQN